MEEINKEQYHQLLESAPGGIAKIAFDDMLTILYATDKFYSLIKNVSGKTGLKEPVSLLRMVYSADIIYLTQQVAAQKQSKDNRINLNFRALQHDGSFKWVMITGIKIEETFQNGNKSAPIYSCVIVDVTQHMTKYKKLEQTNDYHRIISELSKEMFFEYEIANDTLSFSEVFREVFGKENVMEGFRKRLDKTKMIYEDELPAVISIYNSMMSGRKLARFELRLIPKGGVPSWYTCYASIIYDENRNPYKVVGKLTPMNIIEKDADIIPHISQIDAVSNVCTKESAEILIKEAVENQKPEELSALMVIDIRNFKGINEIRRSIQGENIITTVGKVLKNHFRTSDIIGRFGLSEFVVYMKNIQSDQAVYEIANHLCKAIEAIHSYDHTKNGLAASIGIALHLGSVEYSMLTANANTALIMAKKVPTSSFEVFSGMIG